jgi:hypothetical protein
VRLASITLAAALCAGSIACRSRDGETRITLPTCRAHYPGGSSGCSCRAAIETGPRVLPDHRRHRAMHEPPCLELYAAGLIPTSSPSRRERTECTWMRTIRKGQDKHAGRLSLAPDLVKAAIEGRLPHGMGVVRLADLPAEWRQHQDARASSPIAVSNRVSANCGLRCRETGFPCQRKMRQCVARTTDQRSQRPSGRTRTVWYPGRAPKVAAGHEAAGDAAEVAPKFVPAFPMSTPTAATSR